MKKEDAVIPILALKTLLHDKELSLAPAGNPSAALLHLEGLLTLIFSWLNQWRPLRAWYLPSCSACGTSTTGDGPAQLLATWGGHPSTSSSGSVGLILKQMNCAQGMPLLSLQRSTSTVTPDAVIYLKDIYSYMRQIPVLSPLSALCHGKVLIALPRAGNSSISWFLKCSHLINVTGLSFEICEWNMIVWAKRRVRGDELKVYPGLRCKEIEPEPNTMHSC